MLPEQKLLAFSIIHFCFQIVGTSNPSIGGAPGLLGSLDIGEDNPEITDLPQNKSLDLTNKGLYKVPDWVLKSKNLTKLYLSNNHLQSLSEVIGNLTDLKELYLSKNKLKYLPEVIGNLTSLKKLNLSNNELEWLPEEVENLKKNLDYLDLSNNNLEWLPEVIGNITSLKELVLTGNPLIEDGGEGTGKLGKRQLKKIFGYIVKFDE